MLLGMDIPMSLYIVSVVTAMLDSLLMVSLEGTVMDTDTVCRTRNEQFDGYSVYISLPARSVIN